ncbi:MAG: hypothetical protein KDD55_01605 [Bdellovibrionales bacterium]|nr:hypothetical protein [Bdellovibrionales bacterium]
MVALQEHSTPPPRKRPDDENSFGPQDLTRESFFDSAPIVGETESPQAITEVVDEMLHADGELEGKLEEEVERLVGQGAGISWHFTMPDALPRKALFEKMCKPYVLPGRMDISPFLFYGGLTATGYPYRDFASKLYDRSGIHTEVRSLAGHDGTWSGLRDTTEQDWIDDVEENARKFPIPPVGFFYSTSVPVAFEVERRNPGTFAAIVAIAGPLALKNEQLEKYLDRGLAASRFVRLVTARILKPFRYGSVGMEHADPELLSKSARKSPGYSKLPLLTSFSLRRIQKLAIEAASEIHIPFFYAQGSNDHVVSGSVVDFLQRTVPAETKEIHLYEGSGHGPQLDHNGKALLRDISAFLRRTLEQRFPEKDIPNFTDRIYQAQFRQKIVDLLAQRHSL